MVRTELREHIFKMLFQIEFNDSVDMPENLNYYFETLEDAKEKDKQYIQNKYEAILSHIEEIDGLLNENATGWKTTRMNKVDLSILRLALYEIKWDEDVPAKVASGKFYFRPNDERRKQYLSANRFNHVGRIVGEECYSYRRICP